MIWGRDIHNMFQLRNSISQVKVIFVMKRNKGTEALNNSAPQHPTPSTPHSILNRYTYTNTWPGWTHSLTHTHSPTHTDRNNHRQTHTNSSHTLGVWLFMICTPLSWYLTISLSNIPNRYRLLLSVYTSFLWTRKQF